MLHASTVGRSALAVYFRFLSQSTSQLHFILVHFYLNLCHLYHVCGTYVNMYMNIIYTYCTN